MTLEDALAAAHTGSTWVSAGLPGLFDLGELPSFSPTLGITQLGWHNGSSQESMHHSSARAPFSESC